MLSHTLQTISRAAGLILIAAALVGCQAYANTMNSILDSGALPVISGSVTVVNTMSVPVCGVTMVQPGDPGGDDHLRGEQLLPGAEGTVDIPWVGKPSEQTPQPETWTMQVFSCDQRSPYTVERGSQLLTIEGVKASGSPPVAIR